MEVYVDMTQQNNISPLLILAAGGTGGHVFPAQALAEEMLSRGWRVALWTDSRGFKFSKGFPKEVEVRRVASATPSRGNLWKRSTAPLKLLLGIVASWLRLRLQKPAVVAGFGGYPAFPPLFAAYLSNIPRLIHEQNGVFGRANRMLSRRVNIAVCGAVSTQVPAGVASVTAGNPVRAEVLALANDPYQWPQEGTVNLLVIGGSQGACIMDHAVPAAVGRLPEDVRKRLKVMQQVRPCHTSSVMRYYDEAGVKCEISEFFDDVPRRMAESHIVVARAGASTLAEISVIGRPAILIPFAAAANDHQTANAGGLVHVGAAIAVKEKDSSPERLMRELQLLFDNPKRAESMARAASSAGIPRAASKIADEVERLLKSR